MSKQQDAKKAQGYEPKPRVCGSCAHFLSDIIDEPTKYNPSYQRETNMRCGLGGFAVKKMGTCNQFEKK